MDALKLRATLGLDKKGYDDGLKDAENNAGQAGSKIAGLFTGTAKAVGVGLAAASAAVGGLVKSSVSAYAEYEQLAGGVETLFKESANIVMGYAENAYKTAGLSANAYMETVTSFSASLLQSLDGDTTAAAAKADLAITDMSDNANKMGTSMEMIQNAYQGFAKSNFMMLDNLKLGYGGTKEEMQRLLEDAEKISGIKYDISSYADIVDAIHVVQTEMGITGTTAKEAASTIQGSLGMVGAAWQNLVTGITNPDADLSVLINNLVDSVKVAAKNLVPAVGQALKGVGQVVEEIAPVISEELPGLVQDLLPMLLNSGITLLNGLIDALPDFMQVLFDQLPMIIEAIVDAVIDLLPMIVEVGFNFIEALIKGLTEAIPKLLPKLTEVVLKIADFFKDPKKLTELITSAIVMIQQLATGLIEALPQIIPALVQVITGIAIALTEPTNLMRLIQASVQIMIAIADGLLQAIPVLLQAIPTIFMNLLEAIILYYPTMIEAGMEFLSHFIMGLLELKARLVLAITNLLNSVKTKIKERIDDAKQWGKDLIQNFIDGILAKWEALKQTVKNVAQSVKDFLGFSEPKLGPLSNFHTYAPDMVDLFIQGINDNKGRLINTVADAFDFKNAIVKSYKMDVDGIYTGAEGNGGGNVYNININQPVDTADNLARVIREEAQYGLIGGGELAY